MKLIQKRRFSGLFMAVCAGFLLSSCSLYQEGTLTENRVQVIEKKFVEEVSLKDATNHYVVGLAHHYDKHGDGPVDLSVTYDPKSRSNTAMNASQEAARLVRSLREEGVRNVNANILPVRGQGNQSIVIVSYMSYTAEAPRDCTNMPGFDDTDITHKEEYRIGCTVESMFAKQIARPKDLLGQGSAGSTTDARRAGNIGERYRIGTPNESLDGETASE